MRPISDDELYARMIARWAVADRLGATKVEEIPLPWRHRWGLVVRLEFPPDRPRVVDLVFDDGLKTAETKSARYIERGGIWDYPDLEHP